MPCVELGHARGRHVEPLDMETGLGKRDRERQADISETDHGHPGVVRHAAQHS